MPSRFDPPRRITNPVTGDRVEFLTSPLSGDRGPLVFRTTLAPRAKGSPLHLHRTMAETFAVERGGFSLLLPDGNIRAMEAGDTVEVPAGATHGFRNDTDSETRFLTTATPGEGFERFLRVMFALAEHGHTTRDGLPTDPRALALTLVYADLVLAGAPRAVQSALVAGLACLGRFMGLERDFDRHLGLVAGAPSAAEALS